MARALLKTVGEYYFHQRSTERNSVAGDDKGESPNHPSVRLNSQHPLGLARSLIDASSALLSAALLCSALLCSALLGSLLLSSRLQRHSHCGQIQAKLLILIEGDLNRNVAGVNLRCSGCTLPPGQFLDSLLLNMHLHMSSKHWQCHCDIVL